MAGTAQRMLMTEDEVAEFSPEDLAGLRVWLKADALAFSDNASVTQWDDSSGNGFHFTSFAPTNRPIYKTNIVNGKPVVRFDGTDDDISATVAADTTFTFFIAAQKRSAPGGSTQTLWSAAGSNVNQIFANSGVHATLLSYFANQASGAVNLTAATAANWNVLAVKISSASSLSVYVNGGTAITFDPADVVTTQNLRFLGANGAGGANAGDYDIAEYIEYDTALSDGNRDSVESYLGTKYGIVVA